MPEKNSSLTTQKVYFDGSFLDNKSGVGRDSRNLLSAAQLAYGGSVSVIYPQLRLFTRVVKNNPVPVRSRFQKILKLRSILTKKPEICHLEKKSVFIQSHLHCIAPEIDNHIKYIVRLHDVFPISNPEWFRWYSRNIFSIGFKNAIARATFICDSRTTESELRKKITTQTLQSKVAHCPVVIPSGILCRHCTGCKSLALNQRYVISVSTLEPRKNFSELVTAWNKSEVFNTNNTFLYIIGRQGWKSSKIAHELTNSGNSWGIRWIKDACDESVQELLRNSEFLVSTSFEEGFNLSVAEAVKQNVPVLISNNQVHTEIYSTVANFYDLRDPIDLSKKIKEQLHAEKLLDNSYKAESHFGDFASDLQALANAIKES